MVVSDTTAILRWGRLMLDTLPRATKHLREQKRDWDLYAEGIQYFQQVLSLSFSLSLYLCSVVLSLSLRECMCSWCVRHSHVRRLFYYR
jgi:hypothetical protein